MERPFNKLVSSCLIAAATYVSAAPPAIKTKIVVESVAQKQFLDDAPCFIVYPEGEARKILEDSGATGQIETAIEKMGYTIVRQDSDALVYIQVGFKQFEPYAKEIEIKGRATFDYSNSAAATNYAATTGNARYTQASMPTGLQSSGDPTSILGPTGEIIVVGDQQEKGISIIEPEEQILKTTIYPMTFEVSAWVFEKSDNGVHPNQLWKVLASYNNLRDEEAHPQLLDLSKAASGYFGKNLKKEKFIARK